MSQIEDEFLATITTLGATSETLVNLESVGPPLVAQGYDLEAICECLMRLIREKRIVHVGERNAVRLP